jgi:hypothetical protein
MLATCFTLISFLTDVSEKYVASVFTVASCLAYSALKMEEKYSSGTSVDFQRSTLRYNPEDRTLFIRHNMAEDCLPQKVCLLEMTHSLRKRGKW